MSPDVSRSRRPTGYTRFFIRYPSARSRSMMLDRTDRSVVQVTPRAFQYLMYSYALFRCLDEFDSDLDDDDDAADTWFRASHPFTTFPSRRTTSRNGATRRPAASTGAPLTVTRPSAMRSSACRRECVALNTLLRRIPVTSPPPPSDDSAYSSAAAFDRATTDDADAGDGEGRRRRRRDDGRGAPRGGGENPDAPTTKEAQRKSARTTAGLAAAAARTIRTEEDPPPAAVDRARRMVLIVLTR
mmetsp:Transcript_28071/g.82590  ORF Transcript_28071/g.82590 Transcript_28071/m.82590 type:complete len:243 (+) Transcript_28071:730-1458(+)